MSSHTHEIRPRSTDFVWNARTLVQKGKTASERPWRIKEIRLRLFGTVAIKRSMTRTREFVMPRGAVAAGEAAHQITHLEGDLAAAQGSMAKAAHNSTMRSSAAAPTSTALTTALADSGVFLVSAISTSCSWVLGHDTSQRFRWTTCCSDLTIRRPPSKGRCSSRSYVLETIEFDPEKMFEENEQARWHLRVQFLHHRRHELGFLPEMLDAESFPARIVVTNQNSSQWLRRTMRVLRNHRHCHHHAQNDCTPLPQLRLPHSTL
jgi:hypothetical protein